MKKTFLKIIVFILNLVMVCSAFGCSDKSHSKKEDVGETGGRNNLQESSCVLVENGSSVYKIVVPDQADETIDFAATELQTIFEKSTGVTLPILYSQTVGTDLSGHYLSIGETDLKEAANVSVEKLKTSGYGLFLKENTLIMAGKTSRSTLYAVYEFLEKNLGYRYYADNEIFVRDVINAKLLAFDYTYEPPFAATNIAAKSAGVVYGGERLKTKDWVLPTGWPHSYGALLPKDKYPDYWVPGTSILCLSNQQMWEDAALNVIASMEETGHYSYMLSAEDAWGKCSCDTCEEMDAKYSHSGLYVLFGNYVAKRVREYFAQTNPAVSPKIFLLAYFDTKSPPVKEDEKGNISLIDQTLKGEENLYVQVCLVEQDFSSSIYSTANQALYNQLVNWKLVTSNLWAYIYDGWEVNYNSQYFFDWEYKADTVKALAENGYEAVQWEMCPSSTTALVAFEKLKAYHITRLMFDLEADSNQIIVDFMEHYYKEAAPYVLEYFDLFNLNFKLAKESYAAENKHLGQYVQLSMNKYLFDERVFPELLLERVIGLLEQGVSEIENCGVYEGNALVDMLTRVKTELTFPRYYQLKIYGTDMSDEDYREKAEKFNEDVADLGGNVFVDANGR